MAAVGIPSWEKNKIHLTREQYEDNKRKLIEKLIAHALGVKDLNGIYNKYGEENIKNFIEEMADKGGRYKDFTEEIEKILLIKNLGNYDINGFHDSFINEFRAELGFYLDEVKRRSWVTDKDKW